MSEVIFGALVGGIGGVGLLLVRRLGQTWFLWIGTPLAVGLGALHAWYGLSGLPAYPMHEFESAPRYYYVPSIVAMLAVLGAVGIVWRWKPALWAGGVLGAAVYMLGRLLVWAVMIL